jgi:hypothetical protein
LEPETIRIVYMISSLPHGKNEVLMIPEISELKWRRLGVLIVPTYPREAVLHDDAKALLSDVVF